MKAVVAAVLGAVLLAVPAVAQSRQRTISVQDSLDAIRQNLQYHAPQYVVLLDQALLDAGVVDLERKGIVEIASTTLGCRGRQSTLVVTRKGQSVAEIRGWLIYGDVLTIPVGSFTYVPNSATILRGIDGPYAIRFQFRYVPDANANVLLAIGRAKDWETGDDLTLLDANRIYTKTVPLFYTSSRGWYLKEEWISNRTPVC